jgi:hypothetical protein
MTSSFQSHGSAGAMPRAIGVARAIGALVCRRPAVHLLAFAMETGRRTTPATRRLSGQAILRAIRSESAYDRHAIYLELADALGRNRAHPALLIGRTGCVTTHLLREPDNAITLFRPYPSVARCATMIAWPTDE